jgi:glyoxylase-like metal-dependent hydrolase (beta-lactamase superfamily II)
VKITDSIYLIPGVRGANSYLFLGKEGVVVVDTGMRGNASKIVKFGESLGKEPASLAYIVLTHPDMDHSGSVARLKELTKAKVAIHGSDAPRLSGEMKLKEAKGAIGTLFAIMSPFMRFKPVKPDILLEDSGTIAGLTVIHTPGHTDGSVSLYLPDQALFVGDALRTNGKGLPELPSGSMSVNMDQARDSVRKISELNFVYLLPGHGPPIVSDASAKLKGFVREDFRNR